MIGLFYGTITQKTLSVAEQIQSLFGDTELTLHPVDAAWKDDFMLYDKLIIGVPTWFDGELSTDWDELLPELATLDLHGKKVAVFGLGDQLRYPDNFVDGIGILSEALQRRGAVLVGKTAADGYTFTASKALHNGRFLGLAIDPHNQPEQTSRRIEHWVAQLRKEFAD